MSSLTKILRFTKNKEESEYYNDIFSFANHNVNKKWFDSEVLIDISNSVYSNGFFIYTYKTDVYKFETVNVKGGFPDGKY